MHRIFFGLAPDIRLPVARYLFFAFQVGVEEAEIGFRGRNAVLAPTEAVALVLEDHVFDRDLVRLDGGGHVAAVGAADDADLVGVDPVKRRY